MDVRLKVLLGPNIGREVPVVGSRFLVGRAEDCQLRPRSDLISRHHCVLLIEEGFVAVRDFGSKNGTLVNGQRVIGELELHPGDKLGIGPLEFEVCVHAGVASKKRPKVESVKEAATRAAQNSDPDLEIDEWVKQDEAQATAETRRLTVNETDEIKINDAASETQVGTFQPQPPTEEPTEAKKPPGKLPPMPAGKDSGQAATDVLNKFFKRR